MKIHIQRDSGVPIVEQIVQEISDRIRSGLLEAGTQIPSVRNLATQLQVSPMTIVRVFNLLEEKGYIERIHGKGTFVKGKAEKVIDAPSTSSTHWQLTVKDYLPRAQYWRQQQLFQPDQIDISLAIASVHPSLLPQVELLKELEQLIKKDPERFFQYGPLEGDLSLRTAIAHYLKKRGLSISPEEMLITNGSQQAIHLIADCFVGPGDVVIMEAPTYSAAIDVFRKRQATIFSVPLDSDGLHIDSLIQLCDQYPPKLIYTIPDFQNPTGVMMSAHRRAQLLELASIYQAIIVEDDTWSEVSYIGEPPPPIKALDQSGHVVYMKGFSKILAPGFRVSACCASGSILQRLVATKAISDLGSPLLTQQALSAYINSNQMRKHITQLTRSLQRRRDLVIECLEKWAPEEVTWTVPAGGYNLWLTLPISMNADDLIYVARKEGLSFLPGSWCYPEKPEWNHIRISFSQTEESDLEKGIQLLCQILHHQLPRTLSKYPLL